MNLRILTCYQCQKVVRPLDHEVRELDDWIGFCSQGCLHSYVLETSPHLLCEVESK